MDFGDDEVQDFQILRSKASSSSGTMSETDGRSIRNYQFLHSYSINAHLTLGQIYSALMRLRAPTAATAP